MAEDITAWYSARCVSDTDSQQRGPDYVRLVKYLNGRVCEQGEPIYRVKYLSWKSSFTACKCEITDIVVYTEGASYWLED